MYIGYVMANLKLFLTKYNINHTQAKRHFASGALLKLDAGVYIQNPFKSGFLDGEDDTKKAALINHAIESSWLLIISQYIRGAGSVLTFDTAYELVPDAQNVIRIAATSFNSPIKHLCNNIEGDIPEYTKKLITPLAIKYIKLRHVFDEEVEGVFNEDVFNEYKSIAPLENGTLEDMASFVSIRRFSHERLLMEFLSLDGGNTYLTEKFKNEYLKIGLSRSGWPALDAITPKEVGNIIQYLTRLRPIGANAKTTKEDLAVRLCGYLHLAKNIPSLEVYWYNQKKGDLLSVGGTWRLINDDNWSLPGGKTLSNISPFINNLMPEMFKIAKPNAIEKYWGDSRRLMTNIRICKHDPSRVIIEDNFTTRLDRSRDTFEGLVTGAPEYNFKFYENAVETNMREGMTSISGVMIKFGMNLSVDEHGIQKMSLADDIPTTHLLKLPNPEGKLAGITALEWLGMELAKAAGNITPTFQLAEVSQGSKASSDLLSARDIEHSTSEVEQGLYLGSELDSIFSQDLDMFGNSNEIKLPVGFVIERYDLADQYEDIKYLQFDMLVAMGIGNPESKYDFHMEDMAGVVKSVSTNWESDSQRLFRQTVSALLTCNGDMHAKNISMLASFDREENMIDCVLSPTYDFTVSRGIVGLSNDDQALPVNNNLSPTESDLMLFGVEHCDLPLSLVKDIINDVGTKVAKRLKEVTSNIPALISGDPTLANSYDAGVIAVQLQLEEFGFYLSSNKERDENNVINDNDLSNSYISSI
jgi:hypothetical protein